MASCCEDKSCEITALRVRHGRVLWTVLALNALMFFVEGTAGLGAHSTSLLADALDMMGDALVYGFSLFVLGRSVRWQAGAALGKGAFMIVFAVAVLAEAVHKAIVPVMPATGVMGIVGGLALIANLICFGLLYRHRADGLDMRSTWLCSRNDLIANLGVIGAALSSVLLVSRWPDVVVGGAIALLFLATGVDVLKRAAIELRRTPPSVRTVELVRRRA